MPGAFKLDHSYTLNTLLSMAMREENTHVSLPSPLPSLLTYRAELDSSTVNSGPVRKEGRKERRGDLLCPLAFPPSSLAGPEFD